MATGQRTYESNTGRQGLRGLWGSISKLNSGSCRYVFTACHAESNPFLSSRSYRCRPSRPRTILQGLCLGGRSEKSSPGLCLSGFVRDCFFLRPCFACRSRRSTMNDKTMTHGEVIVLPIYGCRTEFQRTMRSSVSGVDVFTLLSAVVLS